MLHAGVPLLLCTCLSFAQAQLVHHRITFDVLSEQFEAIRPASPSSYIDFRLVLPPPNVEDLHSALQEVSDPVSHRYGKYLSKSEVEELVAPRPESVEIIRDWLAQNGVEAEIASPSGDTLRVQVPVQQANAWLNATFTQYVHKQTGALMVRTLSYSVPAQVQEHLSFIYPSTQFVPPSSRGELSSEAIQASSFPSNKRYWQRTRASSQCAQYTTPECLQDLYSIPPTPATATGNKIFIGGFLDDIATSDDLARFMQTFRSDIQNPEFGIVPLDNGTTQGQGTSEAASTDSLDVDYTVGLATDVPVELSSIGDSTYEGLLDLVNYLLSQNDLPSVVTTSYGYDEPIFAQYPEMAHTLCNAYAQLGARGTTVLFSSGDGGVSGHQAQNNVECDSSRPFVPTFPSTCPFVTSVGGAAGRNPETAAPFSAGGFSNLFPRPSYQLNAVQGYLDALGSTYAGRFNASGRAFPDVSTQAVQFVIRANDQFLVVNGTSAASPTFASVVALLNDRRLNAGQPLLGFLNPLLYSNTSAAFAFNDITSGSNPGCGTEGFPALPGWDPVTGLGTPAYNRLLALVAGHVAAKNG